MAGCGKGGSAGEQGKTENRNVYTQSSLEKSRKHAFKACLTSFHFCNPWFTFAPNQIFFLMQLVQIVS